MAANVVDNRARAQHLYEIVLRVSNHFLHNCKTFSIEVLQLDEPTYAELAQIMKKAAGIIELLVDEFDPMMGQKAHEYCELMRLIGVAIEQDDEIGLRRHLVELDRRPGL